MWGGEPAPQGARAHPPPAPHAGFPSRFKFPREEHVTGHQGRALQKLKRAGRGPAFLKRPLRRGPGPAAAPTGRGRHRPVPQSSRACL